MKLNRKSEPRRQLRVVAPLACTLVCTACSVRVLAPTSADDVRTREQALQETNRQLEQENDGLQKRLASAEQSLSPTEQANQAATPRLVSMRIDSMSVVREESDGQAILQLRMAPADDRGRFMQVVGQLDVRAVAVYLEGPPKPLAVLHLDPVAVRDGWRGGLLGSGYLFELPLGDVEIEDLPSSIDVVTRFSDSTGGPSLRDELAVRVLK